MDISYLYFILIILALVGVFYLLTRMDKKQKNRYKIDAYRLLDMQTPPQSEVLRTMKMLRLYGGRWRKDKEFVQLINRLSEKLDKTE